VLLLVVGDHARRVTYGPSVTTGRGLDVFYNRGPTVRSALVGVVRQKAAANVAFGRSCRRAAATRTSVVVRRKADVGQADRP
jgi:hypothetical protein